MDIQRRFRTSSCSSGSGCSRSNVVVWTHAYTAVRGRNISLSGISGTCPCLSLMICYVCTLANANRMIANRAYTSLYRPIMHHTHSHHHLTTGSIAGDLVQSHRGRSLAFYRCMRRCLEVTTTSELTRTSCSYGVDNRRTAAESVNCSGADS